MYSSYVFRIVKVFSIKLVTSSDKALCDGNNTVMEIYKILILFVSHIFMGSFFISNSTSFDTLNSQSLLTPYR